MFTGLVTDVGEVVNWQNGTFRIRSNYALSDADVGCSIACDGVCLTVTKVDDDCFWADVSNETLAKSTIRKWLAGSRINLERALKLGDALGGHLVQGHVDGIAEIISMQSDGQNTRIIFQAPEVLARFITPKGSVALNGTSLTVNEVVGARFGVNLIPHSFNVSNWKHKIVGDEVNLEVDMLARHVERLLEFRKHSVERGSENLKIEAV